MHYDPKAPALSIYQPALLRSQPYVAPWLKSADPAGALSPGAAELASLVPEGLTRGLPEMVADVIKACDTDTRRELWGGVVVSTLLNAFFIFLKIVLRAGRAALPAQNAMDALSYLVAAARNFAIWARFRARAPSGCELLRLERRGCFEFTLELLMLRV